MTHPVHDGAHVIHVGRWVCLCGPDHDNGDYVATDAIAADGTEHLAIVERAINDDPLPYDPTCRDDAPHEQLGPLPGKYTRRLRGNPLCGPPTAAGTPCGHPVPLPGNACAWHGRAESGNRLAPGSTPFFAGERPTLGQ